MKRREMLGKILKALVELDTLCPDGYDYEEQSEHLLKRIEEAGMAPPEIDSGIYNRSCENFFVHEWKSEDEN